MTVRRDLAVPAAARAQPAARRRPLRRALRVWLALAGTAGAALLLALALGSSQFALSEIVRVLFQPDASPAAEVVHQLRLPRALAAFATGGLLALAGALMQILLRNPLADPYILGLSGGAAAGALGAMIVGLSAALTGAAAFGGALISVALVFGIANRDLARLEAPGAIDTSPRLLLTGVILASGWSAIITLLLTVAPEARLRGMLFWMMGDLGGVESYAPALLALPLLLVALFPLARDLNVLLRGPVVAHALGVRVVRLRRILYVIASLATALAVITAGTVGFIGLIVPHALRLAIGNDQRVLLPASVLAGGTLLLLADTAARTALAPQQLPVGVITALLGVPTFIFLLLRRRGET
ncbi:MAG: iron ABC transporter permease [Betaproteobacteria bacterium]|nr:iron ABC transporter permease [Betaproteobacteria bacterium]